MPTYARWTGRDQLRRYAELDDDGALLRYIELRATDGTYLAATARESTLPPVAVPRADDMPADEFAELWRLARAQLDGVVELEVHEVRPREPDGLPVVVRCVSGRLQVGSALLGDTGEPGDLVVTRIRRYDRDLRHLDPAGTALLTLSGPPGARVRSGTHLRGRTAP